MDVGCRMDFSFEDFVEFKLLPGVIPPLFHEQTAIRRRLALGEVTKTIWIL